ncbi:hypothetical protein NUW54_g13845 [Trametes sanguinea]|uniref:Uncharacterized protein n=1 Tax=Trametes sanguinea TaxID=158606 RepID=A0ACC1MHV8_9APHY|nr:hypothetical protein NUW54_g13845 [Trametes sanguinea]
MHTKKTLSLVSKQWNALARAFLYEFVWISRAAQAKALARTLLMEYVENLPSSGKFIRRLHIETPALERCAPADLRTILDYSPHLYIYSDHHSVQRSMIEDAPDPRCSPEEILKLIAHPKIRRLSWTNYYDDVPFELRMAPLGSNLTTRLEYLELSTRSPNLPNLSTILSGASSSSSNQFEHLQMNVQLPALRALKVSLDNNTFAVLASWDMPSLTHLSVMSSDFSYTGEGFSRFFQAHGAKLIQLELGHSSSALEEYYLTTPQHLLVLQQQNQQQQTQPIVPLAEWCPNLREFICSADAEWHWQSPDWIAPHILLPAHPKVELIGIRDIDTRLLEDPLTPLHAYQPPLSSSSSRGADGGCGAEDAEAAAVVWKEGRAIGASAANRGTEGMRGTEGGEAARGGAVDGGCEGAGEGEEGGGITREDDEAAGCDDGEGPAGTAMRTRGTRTCGSRRTTS